MQGFKVNKDNSGLRADVYLAGHYPKFARSALKPLFDNEMIKLNDANAKPSDRLKENDVLTVDETSLYVIPENIELPIIYEDENVIVIDKPAGVLTHSKGSINKESTVASFIKPRLDDSLPDTNRSGIVHRLDRPTSGVIITAKNAATLTYLQKQFSQRKTKKSYAAIIKGTLNPRDAIIDAPIERNPKKPQTFRIGAAGKSAQTEYHTVKEFSKGKIEYSQLELKPATGRTHQLRVHMAYLKHPIVGDSVYGDGDGNILLHALSLELTLPGGFRKTFTSPLPNRILDFINE
jgi:23S rRNA pseudouridine1911/1915/1917 synthase